ncbi:hypothetical protein BS333_02910 [Vibrio azureus]|uniref:Uncharacterized protein n=1 Tax=Vibrio azureus NBRC 104587 TaxID=1219077 RepID=U3AT55_9VIBR|nr:hypothetical protein [Vibrio azureus]AUI85415.1 hypothetical protein BS333_02910 [Vibrio azureus]GAD76422.1 hypothetical protein VAZ01S_044_00030 [Vibrio azureus NBRC 104587]
MKRKILTLLLTTSPLIFSFNVNANPSNTKHHIYPNRNVEPICVNPSKYKFQPLENQSASLNTNFHNSISWNGTPKSGFDYIEISQQQFEEWSSQCDEGFHLEGYIPSLYNLSLFKIIDSPNGAIFAKGEPSLVCKDSSMRVCDTTFRIFNIMEMLSKQTGNRSVGTWMEKERYQYTINVLDQEETTQNHIDHQQKVINIGLQSLNETYLTTEGEEVKFTLQRLVVSQVVQAALADNEDNPIIIEQTNQLLSHLGYSDKPRRE